MLVHFSITGHWFTEVVAMIYIFYYTDYDEIDAIFGACGMLLYNAAFFTF